MVFAMPSSRPVIYTPAEGAGYIYEMLVSLRKIALMNQQVLLAHMLDLAAAEAKAQADQETSLPG